MGMAIGLGAMGLLVASVAWIWNKFCLEDLGYERIIPHKRVFKGEKVPLSIELSNRKPIPISRIDIDDDLDEFLTVDGATLGHSPDPHTTRMRHSTSMSWYEKVRWDYLISGNTRGYLRIGPATLISGDGFGLFQSIRRVRSDDYLLIYPDIVELPVLGLPESRPLGDVEHGIRMFQDPSRPSGIRDYQTSDPMKFVDWKATARSGDLKVRTFEPSSSQTVVLIVAIETSLRFWEGYSAVNLERIITCAASLASYVSDQGYSLGLFSNGTPILSDRPMKISPSRSAEQLTVILETLATVRPLPMGSMTSNLSENVNRFPMGATLVITASIITEEFVEVIERLKRFGYKIVVTYVSDNVCPTMPEGTLVYELGRHFAELERTGDFHAG